MLRHGNRECAYGQCYYSKQSYFVAEPDLDIVLAGNLVCLDQEQGKDEPDESDNQPPRFPFVHSPCLRSANARVP